MMTKPEHGGMHGTFAVFLGGGAVDPGWKMSKARYHFSIQRRDEKSVSKVERGSTGTRDRTMTLKFNGTMELYGADGN
jgi:hypothetical protein